MAFSTCNYVLYVSRAVARGVGSEYWTSLLNILFFSLILFWEWGKKVVNCFNFVTLNGKNKKTSVHTQFHFVTELTKVRRWWKVSNARTRGRSTTTIMILINCNYKKKNGIANLSFLYLIKNILIITNIGKSCVCVCDTKQPPLPLVELAQHVRASPRCCNSSSCAG